MLCPQGESIQLCQQPLPALCWSKKLTGEVGLGTAAAAAASAPPTYPQLVAALVRFPAEAVNLKMPIDDSRGYQQLGGVEVDVLRGERGPGGTAARPAVAAACPRTPKTHHRLVRELQRVEQRREAAHRDGAALQKPNKCCKRSRRAVDAHGRDATGEK